MRGIIFVFSMLACAWTLEITPLNSSEKILLHNNSNASVQVLMSQYLDKAPEYSNLATISTYAASFVLAADESREFAWEPLILPEAKPGAYLFWLVFSTEVFRQNTEAGDFIVQDDIYWPYVLLVQNNE